MKQVDYIPNKDFQLEVLDMLRIANQAVAKAKAENKKKGIPDTFIKNGKLYYVLVDGTITGRNPTKTKVAK